MLLLSYQISALNQKTLDSLTPTARIKQQTEYQTQLFERVSDNKWMSRRGLLMDWHKVWS